MSHKRLQLKEGAYLLCDAHYSKLRPQLLGFIEAIHEKELRPTQLILMGDIFDALFGGVAYTEMQNRKMIRLINEIARFIEVIYLEGNHDFLLSEYFHKVKIFPIESQPIFMHYGSEKVALAHGDFDADWKYKLYCWVIRSRNLVRFLSLFDTLFGHPILKRLDAYLAKKDDCNEFKTFEEFVRSRDLDSYGSEYFLEGHFHQNKHFGIQNCSYSNLAAFACNQRYFVVKSLQDKELLEEKSFS